MKKALLIPSDHGGGMGHVSRCLFLAGLMRKESIEPALILEPKHYKSGVGNEFKTFLLDTRTERILKYQFKKPFKSAVKLKKRIYRHPSFVEFSSLAYQVPRDGYVSQKIVKNRFNRICKIIDYFKPNILIGDTHFLTKAVGTKYSIPVVQITRVAGYPPDPDFFWWKNTPGELKEPKALNPFQILLDELNLNVSKIEDLLKGDIYLIPATQAIEPVKKHNKPILFSGPLTTISSLPKRIPFFDVETEFPKIYVSIGGGAGRNREKLFFDTILKIFDKKEYSVLVSTGKRIQASNYNKSSLNVHFEDWVHGSSAIMQSDLTIYHGGYGTTMEILSSGKPAIVLPSHSEQEGNGRRLEALGVGKTILFSNERKTLDFTWPYGEYNMLAGFDFELSDQTLLKNIHNLLYKDSFKSQTKISSELIRTQKEFDIKKLFE